ncbi:hypothetical protein B0A48_09505 [Cryoendolithus antarcticus]|uniref:CPAF-like PDZ domain-containing protein n=1 Tax=Cryoendolithus antarcticus TaxID=1507870 RepID=A0A1V8SZJ4_9PEZI|nr:hypothetical protein B0A48_09505 [Cryoendolithus antarcticus]
MHILFLSSALVASAAASPFGAWKPIWNFGHHKPPGWYVDPSNLVLPKIPTPLEYTDQHSNGRECKIYNLGETVPSAEVATIMTATSYQQAKRHNHVPATSPATQKPSVYTPAYPKPAWSGHSWVPESSYHPGSTSPPAGTPTATVTSASVTSATLSATSGAGNGTTSLAACGRVSSLVAASRATGTVAVPTVPASLAYECVTSIPFNSSAAVALMDSLRPYLNWQTTIEYLKSPPAEYAAKVQGPYDFYANFDRIYESAKANAYPYEYAFGFDVYELFQVAHDGHFVYYPDSVTAVFSFGRRTPLVSVSVDGVAIPEVYAYSDVLASSFGNITYTPSPLVEINDQNSTDFLLNWSQYGSLQDRDALWNNLFYTLAQVSLGSGGTGTGTFSGGGRGARVYPGPNTKLTFANGTSVTTENFARVILPSFAGINTGEDIYQKYFIPPPGQPQLVEQFATSTSSSSSIVTTTAAAATTIPAPGYPSPIIREKANLNSGYFLDGEGYDDVAVLSVPSFVGTTSDEIPFQSVNTYLINRALAENKTKLIIDVSANGGGTILQGYDLFKQLFPHILPYGGTRFRAHEAFDLIGQEVSAYSALVPRSLSTNQTVQDIVSSAFNYRTDADINYEPFDSWAEKFGPHAYGPEPDNFTSIIRWNLSDVLTPDNSGGIYVSGYLNRSNITAQPFLAENVVVVYDGYCASTCTIFSELMRQQAGIKTIALGGRPNRDIIQAVGGVKGTNDFPWDYILQNVELPFQLQLLHDAGYYNKTALGEYSNLPFYRATNYVVNSRDGIREGDESETPLQFVYEEADCRIYYTPAMVVDETAVWKTVADTAFNGISHCVAGSLSSNATAKRSAPMHKRAHGVRRDLETEAHFAAIGTVWTGSDGTTLGGDSFMYP